MKRTVAKTSVCSSEMVLGLAGGEFFRILPPSWWLEPLLLLLSNRRIEKNRTAASLAMDFSIYEYFGWVKKNDEHIHKRLN